MIYLFDKEKEMNKVSWKKNDVVDFMYSGIEDDVEMIDGSYVGCLIDVMEDVVIEDKLDRNYGWNKKCWEVEIMEVLDKDYYRGKVLGRDEKYVKEWNECSSGKII